MTSFLIGGLGTAVPAHEVEQARAAELTSRLSGHDAAQTRRLVALYRRAGVKTRRVALMDRLNLEDLAPGPDPLGPSTRARMEHYEQAAGPLALTASRQALQASAIEPGAITHLITVSCTGFHAPGFDMTLIQELGLNPGIARTHVGFMGCHGALNGLRVARAFAAAEPFARVLLCAAELCSLHFRFGWDAEQAVSNALFGDGAAALVGWNDRWPAVKATDDRAWRAVASGSQVMPDTQDAMSWRIGDHGFTMTLSPQVAGQIEANLRPWLTGWLARHDLAIGDVGSWAVHPGGPRILDAVQSSLGLPPEALATSRAVLADSGNMSSPTVLFIIDRLRRAAATLPCVSLGFGPGAGGRGRPLRLIGLSPDAACRFV